MVADISRAVGFFILFYFYIGGGGWVGEEGEGSSQLFIRYNFRVELSMYDMYHM